MINFQQGTTLATQLFTLGSFDDVSLGQIIEILQTADDLYTNEGESFLTDEQYDALKQYAQRMAPAHVYFTGVGSSVRGGKVKLPYPMGSLTQAYQGDMQKWIQKHQLDEQQIVITEKLDGISVQLVYGERGRFQIAFSRGDGFEGADVSRHISKIEGVPVRVASREPMVIRAEVIITKENFKKIQPLIKSRSGQPYKNPRNCIAGIMNASENLELVYDYIDVVAYEIIGGVSNKQVTLQSLYEDNQFIIPNHIVVTGKDISDDFLTSTLNRFRNESNYEIDGIVVEVDNLALRKKINPSKETLNPEYARKYKVADAANLATATVKGVEWATSKDGYLKPTVIVEPITLVGVTIQRATGFNAKFIVDNKIGPGAQVKITRSGDVVPYILEVTKPAQAAQMPTQEASWTSTGVDLVIDNAHEDATVKFERLVDFFTSIDAPHLRDGNLKMIFDMGFETPESVIELTQEDLSSLLGSVVVGKKVFQGLRESLTNIPLYKLMGSHSVFGRGVGVRKMKKLYEAFDGDMTKCSNAANILSVDGFDQKTASKIVAGYPLFVDFMKHVEQYVTIEEFVKKKQGPMTGQQIVFTGFRSKEMELEIESLGGKVGTSVSKNTSLVVADDPDSNSGKAKKAKDLGIRVISVEQFKQMLGNQK